MDLKTAVIFSVTKNDRLFQFVAPTGAPLGECYDAAFEVLSSITEQAKAAADKAKKEEKTEAVEAEVVESK